MFALCCLGWSASVGFEIELNSGLCASLLCQSCISNGFALWCVGEGELKSLFPDGQSGGWMGTFLGMVISTSGEINASHHVLRPVSVYNKFFHVLFSQTCLYIHGYYLIQF